MLKYKPIREKGKFSLTKFFQKFKEGDTIAVVRNLGFNLGYSKRVQGRTGKILEKRGAAYYVEISDLGKPKRYLIKPIHLRKIEVKAK
jgi:large subunit ribosomal protein L21e